MPPSLRSSLNCNIILLPAVVTLLNSEFKLGAVVSGDTAEVFNISRVEFGNSFPTLSVIRSLAESGLV